MKIIYVIDSLRAGGKERQAVALLAGLARRGNKVEVVCLGSDDFFAGELHGAGIRIRSVPRRYKADARPLWEIIRAVRELGPDVIHSTCWMTSMFSLPVCRSFGIPLVNGSIRNCFGKGGLKWSMERWLLRVSDVRISNSEEGFRSRSLDPKGRGSFVVYNGFDGDRSAPSPSTAGDELRRWAAERRIVGMVAQFKKDKDHTTFLQAANLLLGKRGDVAFVLVGDGPNLDRYRREHAGESGRILFLGRQSDIEGLVREFCVGVLATFTEGISNSVMEYMALGKPVVATRGGGTAELVVDGLTGTLVPAGDAGALAMAVQRYLDDPGEAARAGGQGRARIQRCFSYPALIERTEAAYRWALESGTTRGTSAIA